MSDRHGEGVTRREALIGAAGGLALAAVELSGGGPERSLRTRKVAGFGNRVRGSRRLGRREPRQSGARRRARLQRPRCRRHRRAMAARRLPLPDACAIFVIKPAGYHAAGRSRRPARRASIIMHSPEGSPASLDLTFAGLAPTGPAARLGRFRASPAGRAGRVRGRDVHRSAAGDRASRSTSSART